MGSNLFQYKLSSNIRPHPNLNLTLIEFLSPGEFSMSKSRLIEARDAGEHRISLKLSIFLLLTL